jgi:hypothetical protein
MLGEFETIMWCGRFTDSNQVISTAFWCGRHTNIQALWWVEALNQASTS